QGLEFIPDLEFVAFDEGDRVLDRHFHLAALLAARGGRGGHPHRAGAGRHVHPGTGGQHGEQQQQRERFAHRGSFPVQASRRVCRRRDEWSGWWLVVGGWWPQCRPPPTNNPQPPTVFDYSATGAPSGSITRTSPSPSARPGASVWARSPTTTQVRASGCRVLAASATWAGVMASTSAMRRTT